MDLTPDKLKELVMRYTTFAFDEFRRDLEVRLAAAIFKETDLPHTTAANMGKGISTEVIKFIQYQVFDSGAIDTAVGKVL
jgi:hypothetical protein